MHVRNTHIYNPYLILFGVHAQVSFVLFCFLYKWKKKDFWKLWVGWSGGGVWVGVVGGWAVAGGVCGGSALAVLAGGWPGGACGFWRRRVGSGAGLGMAQVPALPFGCRILNNPVH